MRASWAAQVTDVCNAVRAAGFAGTMVRDGAGAFGNAPLPENKRNRRGASAALPWTFACSESTDADTQETTRTGGWTNCRLQIGFDIDWHSPDLSANPSDTTHVIQGCDLCDDGDHYLEVTLANGEPGRTDDAAEIKVAGEGEDVPASDYINGVIRIPLATVADAAAGYTPHFNPVVYKYV